MIDELGLENVRRWGKRSKKRSDLTSFTHFKVIMMKANALKRIFEFILFVHDE